CLEPVRTAAGIEIAIERLLENLCHRLEKENKGLRTAILKCYRVDGRIIEASIGTNRASNRTAHLSGLFRLKIPALEPGLGIELFVLEAPETEEVSKAQEALWAGKADLDEQGLAELLDRVAGKIGAGTISRYLPDEHFWPERSIRPALSLREKPAAEWPTDRPRPVRLLARPEPVDVSAPVPDYPPIVFRYKGKVHYIKKADGPERIEREWWLEEGAHRDYYQVEDEAGQRYWLFREGHYSAPPSRKWFLHGFFA
ncbi:MAG TPA: DNA polymerase Y family protein, partial [Anseongella sp.]|nr:DNA polymerase Y family protein [Anseongella sp.]